MKRKDVLELVQEESSQVDLAASNEGPLGEQIVGMEEVGVTVSIKTPTVQHEKRSAAYAATTTAEWAL